MDDPLEQPEFWEDLPDEVLLDINHKEPLPEPHERSSIMQKLTSLLQWFVLFMLLWQANCKISDNGLEWLLRFLFQFLHLLGITCQCDYLVKFCTMFPTSLFVLRQLVHLDRNDFVKYVARSALNVHPCIILETVDSVLVEELLPNVAHTRLLRKDRDQRNVELSWLKK